MFSSFRKIIICILFSVVICAPLFVTGLSKITGKKLDIGLNGYTPAYNKPKFTLESYKTKKFQNDYENYRSTYIRLRGYAIKLYGEINYSLFNVIKDKELSADRDIFEFLYIDAECGITNNTNYSLENNKLELQKYIQSLQSVQRKLQEKQKEFLFFVTPSKAFYHYDNIPLKYRLKKRENFVSGHDYLIELLKDTDINYIDSRDFVFDNDTVFYKTGIHWSRPVEQRVIQAILKNLKQISGKNIIQMELGNLNKSNTPFYRDDDVFKLANTYSKPVCTYYEYDEIFEDDKTCDPLLILMQGGSFMEGFSFKLSQEHTNLVVYDIHYNERTWDNITKEWRPFKSWDELDFQKYLDTVDFVVVELNEASITSYSNGFVDYLDNFLDTYIPSSGER